MAQGQLETDGVYDIEVSKGAEASPHCGGPKYRSLRQRDAFGNHGYDIRDFFLLDHAVHTLTGVFWGSSMNHCLGKQQP